MKSRRQYLTDRMELSKQEKIRTLGEKESCKYLGILKDDTTKLVEMGERKLKKSISEEPENYSRQNSKAEILSKG